MKFQVIELPAMAGGNGRETISSRLSKIDSRLATAKDVRIQLIPAELFKGHSTLTWETKVGEKTMREWVVGGAHGLHVAPGEGKQKACTVSKFIGKNRAIVADGELVCFVSITLTVHFLHQRLEKISKENLGTARTLLSRTSKADMGISNTEAHSAKVEALTAIDKRMATKATK